MHQIITNASVVEHNKLVHLLVTGNNRHDLICAVSYEDVNNYRRLKLNQLVDVDPQIKADVITSSATGYGNHSDNVAGEGTMTYNDSISSIGSGVQNMIRNLHGDNDTYKPRYEEEWNISNTQQKDDLNKSTTHPHNKDRNHQQQDQTHIKNDPHKQQEQKQHHQQQHWREPSCTDVIVQHGTKEHYAVLWQDSWTYFSKEHDHVVSDNFTHVTHFLV